MVGHMGVDFEFIQKMIFEAKKISPTCKIVFLHDCIEFDIPENEFDKFTNMQFKIIKERFGDIKLTIDHKPGQLWKQLNE
jgi:hypothetical protein